MQGRWWELSHDGLNDFQSVRQRGLLSPCLALPRQSPPTQCSAPSSLPSRPRSSNWELPVLCSLQFRNYFLSAFLTALCMQFLCPFQKTVSTTLSSFVLSHPVRRGEENVWKVSPGIEMGIVRGTPVSNYSYHHPVGHYQSPLEGSSLKTTWREMSSLP